MIAVDDLVKITMGLYRGARGLVKSIANGYASVETGDGTVVIALYALVKA